jgi:hypothetical protein
MDKTILNWQQKLLFLYLAFFPFGQLFKFALGFHPTDIIILCIFLLGIISRKIPKKLVLLITILGFSFIFGSTLLQLSSLESILYLLRLVSYLYLGVVAYQSNVELKKSLLVVGIFIGIFGWIQYLFWPDLRQLYLLGWDDHLNRLTGTFLDPAFTGILLVLAFLLAKNMSLKLFFIITTLVTYSRASFLALFVSLLYLMIVKRMKRLAMFLALGVTLILFLPKGVGEGVNLARTRSIELKLENYQQSFEIVRFSPLFGIGFNNTCIAKEDIFGERFGGEHACSGLDNSFLFLLATTGVVGVIAFISSGANLLTKVHSPLFIASFLAVCVHGLFTNTLFYPWIMGWLALLAAREYK